MKKLVLFLIAGALCCATLTACGSSSVKNVVQKATTGGVSKEFTNTCNQLAGRLKSIPKLPKQAEQSGTNDINQMCKCADQQVAKQVTKGNLKQVVSALTSGKGKQAASGEEGKLVKASEGCTNTLKTQLTKLGKQTGNKELSSFGAKV
ncbi:MAG: hypothetical protein J2O48_00375 [Solirubrobacterales bacterium]|nr:hypothetical protein [Solirubrobacterales bacterium]